MMRKYLALMALVLLIAVAGAQSVWAAACTCTQGGVTATATSPYHVLDCSTSGTACTVTDGMLTAAGKGGISTAHHLELENDCAAVVTVNVNGDTAVLHKAMDIQASTTSATGIKIYDIANSPVAVASPGTTTGSGFIPPGPFSLISTGAQTSCFNIFEY